MKKEEFVEAVLSQMLDKTQRPLVKREISDHIDDRIDYFSNAGYSPEESEEKALARMGDPRELGIKMNFLYDNRKYNCVSLIGIAMIALNVLISPFLQVLNYFSAFEESYVDFVTDGSCGIIFLLISLVFMISFKTKNCNHFMSLGIFGFLYYARIIIRLLLLCLTQGGEFIIYFESNPLMSNWVRSAFNLLSDSSFLIVIKITFLVITISGIATSILSFGYGIYLENYIMGNSKTNVSKRYEKFKFIPAIIFAICLLTACIFAILIMKGVPLNA